MLNFVTKLHKLPPKPGILPGFGQYRFKHSDIDSNGNIKPEIIRSRLTFLSDQALLKNPMKYENRTVYGNFHLYNLKTRDATGQSNRSRLAKGHAPVAHCGTDGIVLHHICQTDKGDLVAMRNSTHNKYHEVLHSFKSPRDKVNRRSFDRLRKKYWLKMSESRATKPKSKPSFRPK